ncbi:fungal-specific transcription factor domain-containing protein [Aspergillus multicolor]|uniref:transcription factor domain-containing protein n=1 Tax=Aspergillus multicolor TaxID=41759 RepID=UPI003CCDC192
MNSACGRCHRRKTRCDKVAPSCESCRKAGVACSYVNPARDRQKHIDWLRRRVAELENENRSLSDRLESQSATDDTEHRPTELPAECDANNELTQQISFLSSRAGGESQFLGSSSGILLASLVDVDVPTSQWNAGVETRANPGLLNGEILAAMDPCPLPEESIARALHDAYFEHDHLSYPFLHRATTLATLDTAYRDRPAFDRDVFSCYSFNLVLAIARASVYKFDRESLPDAETYHRRAAGYLNQVLQRGSTQALQAILLLCQYRMVNSTQDTSTSMWHLVGIAARMCLELGLHREQVYQVPNSTGNVATSTVIQSEIRRWCFWSVIATDRVVSITLGRPLAIRLQDTDVSLPQPCLSPTSIFVHIVRYRIICGIIISALHTGSARTQTDAESALGARDRLADTLAGALLMLYRPSPALSRVSAMDSKALETVFAAARSGVIMYAQLHRCKRINYTWITLHAVFMAGLSYIYAVGRHFRSRKLGQSTMLLRSDPTILDIVNACRTCSNVLIAISERWNMAKNCCDIFNRLSDAVLTDAVEYYSKVSGTRNARSIMFRQSNHTPPSLQDEGILTIDSLSHDWMGEIEGMGFNVFL